MSDLTPSVLSCLIFLVCSKLATPTTLAAQDWPNWMGPHHNGLASHDTTIRSAFDGQLTPAWHVKLVADTGRGKDGKKKKGERRDGGGVVAANGSVYVFHMLDKEETIDEVRLIFNSKWKKKPPTGLSEAGHTTLKQLVDANHRWDNKAAFSNWLKQSSLSESDRNFFTGITSNIKAYRINVLTSLSLADGSQQWQVQWKADRNHGWNGGEVHATPAIADGIIYAISSDGSTHARACADGSLIWQSKETVWGTYAGANSSPLIHDGRIYLSRETGQIALAASDGSLLWATDPKQTPIAQTMDNSNTLITSATGAQVLLTPAIRGPKGTRGLFGQDPTTGSILWSIDHGGSRYMTPIVSDNWLVTVQSGASNKISPGIWVYDLSSTPPQKVFNWPASNERTQYIGGQTCSTAIAADGKCWWGNEKGLYCLSLADGSLIWKDDSQKINNYVTPILCGHILIVFKKGSWMAYHAQTGKLLHDQIVPGWKFQLQAPALADGRLLLRDKGLGVMCYDLRPE